MRFHAHFCKFLVLFCSVFDSEISENEKNIQKITVFSLKLNILFWIFSENSGHSFCIFGTHSACQKFILEFFFEKYSFIFISTTVKQKSQIFLFSHCIEGVWCFEATRIGVKIQKKILKVFFGKQKFKKCLKNSNRTCHRQKFLRNLEPNGAVWHTECNNSSKIQEKSQTRYHPRLVNGHL